LKQSLAELRSGQESYARFVTDLLADLEIMQQKLVRAETQVRLQTQQLAELRSSLSKEFQHFSGDKPASDPALQNQVAELESDRQALEEELENIRARAVNMAQIIAEQKRQMSDEHSQWMAELRQLRRILDKQAKWITQQTDMGMVPWGPVNSARHAASLSADVSSAVLAINPDDYAAHPSDQITPASTASQHAPSQRGGAENHPDPMVVSVLSQFDMFQKDVGRRHKQYTADQAVKTAAPPEKMSDR
jgi:hypothetical protein